MEKPKKKSTGSTKNKSDIKPANNMVKLKSEIKNIKEIVGEYNIPEENIHIKIILEKMQERLEYYVKILIQLLQPEEFPSLHECTMFDDTEKAVLFSTYKEMMILHRELMKAHIKNDDENMIITINYVHSELKKLKPQMLDILNKMQESWKRTDTIGRLRYFG